MVRAMGILAAFFAGWVVGARSGERGYQDVVASLRRLRDSEEVRDLGQALRSHLGYTLEDLARRLRGEGEPVSVNDVVETARRLLRGEDPTSTSS